MEEKKKIHEEPTLSLKKKSGGVEMPDKQSWQGDIDTELGDMINSVHAFLETGFMIILLL